MTKRKLVAALAVSTLLLTGCATGPDNGSGDSDEGLSEIKVALASAAVSVGYPYLSIPDALGLYKDEGVNVEVLPVDGTEAAITLLGSKQADVAVGSPEVVVLARAQGDIPMKCIFMMNVENTWQLQVKESSEIRTLSDLEGKTVGISRAGSSAEKYLEVRLADEDVSVNVEVVGSGATAAEALESEKIDALVYWTTGIAAYRNAGYSMRTLPSGEWEKGLYNFCVFATDETIEERSEELTEFLRAIAKASYLTVAEPAIGVNAFWEISPENKGESFQDDLSIVEAQAIAMGQETMGEAADRFWGAQSDEGWDQFQDYLMRAELLDAPLDPNVLYTNELLTEVPAEEYTDLLAEVTPDYGQVRE